MCLAITFPEWILEFNIIIWSGVSVGPPVLQYSVYSPSFALKIFSNLCTFVLDHISSSICATVDSPSPEQVSDYPLVLKYSVYSRLLHLKKIRSTLVVFAIVLVPLCVNRCMCVGIIFFTNRSRSRIWWWRTFVSTVAAYRSVLKYRSREPLEENICLNNNCISSSSQVPLSGIVTGSRSSSLAYPTASTNIIPTDSFTKWQRTL